jgi:hypothetical protein
MNIELRLWITSPPAARPTRSFWRRTRLEGVCRGTLRLPSPVSVSFRLIEDWFDAGSLGPLRDALAG